MGFLNHHPSHFSPISNSNRDGAFDLRICCLGDRLRSSIGLEGVWMARVDLTGAWVGTEWATEEKDVRLRPATNQK